MINGAIPPLAASFGLSAPVNTTMNALVQAIERGGNAPLPRARET